MTSPPPVVILVERRSDLRAPALILGLIMLPLVAAGHLLLYLVGVPILAVIILG